MPWAFKLDHLHSIRPILVWRFFNFSTFILGGVQSYSPREPILVWSFNRLILDRRAADTMYAVLGVTDRYAPEDGEIIRFAPQKYQHARYASATTDYDFSVLRLSRAVNFTDPKMAMVRRTRNE